MKTARFVVKHAVGLHARPAGRFVKLAKGFESTITVCNLTRGSEAVDAKSLVKVIKIAAAQNHEIELTVEGDDEEPAIAAITDFLEQVSEEER